LAWLKNAKLELDQRVQHNQSGRHALARFQEQMDTLSAHISGVVVISQENSA